MAVSADVFCTDMCYVPFFSLVSLLSVNPVGRNGHNAVRFRLLW